MKANLLSLSLIALSLNVASKRLIFLFLFCLSMAGCKEDPKSTKPATDSATASTGTTGYLTAAHVDDTADKTLHYVDAWLAFQDVARELELYKTLFDETGNNKWAKKYNDLLPKYNRLGRKMEEEKKKTSSQ